MMRRTIFSPEHDDFRESVRGFLKREAVPHRDQWEAEGKLDREFWRKAAAQGFVGFEAPEELGGLGIDDYRFNAILIEEACYAGILPDHFMLQNDVLGPYLVELATPEQQARWLPGFTSGDKLAAIAMSEPGAGSDLRGIATHARRDGDDYVLNGSKTFISSGTQADLVVVAARTSAEARASGAFSLLMVEGGMEGFERGRKLEKIGRHSQDTAELFFNDVRVPAANLLGEEGTGLRNLMRNLARERLCVAVAAIAGARFALGITLEYVKDRKAFGTPIGSFQVSRHALAALEADMMAGQAWLDRCIEAEVTHDLDHVEAAALKAWTTELQWRVVDRCLQLHGGYGYMDEYEISRQWRDA
ncbi:MAG: acyl-CoA dehydrogenase, partial [Solirubrobacterales bacterium]|nr:acyl-CoA dehydrogenase [Solirubrobacterales bacterium]